MFKLTDKVALDKSDALLRMNIRNAWLAAPVATVRAEAFHRVAQGKWREAVFLLELAMEE